MHHFRLSGDKFQLSQAAALGEGNRDAEVIANLQSTCL